MIRRTDPVISENRPRDFRIKYNIRKLREKGIIKRIGPDKGGHWEVIEE